LPSLSTSAAPSEARRTTSPCSPLSRSRTRKRAALRTSSARRSSLCTWRCSRDSTLTLCVSVSARSMMMLVPTRPAEPLTRRATPRAPPTSARQLVLLSQPIICLSCSNSSICTMSARDRSCAPYSCRLASRRGCGGQAASSRSMARCHCSPSTLLATAAADAIADTPRRLHDPATFGATLPFAYRRPITRG
jgi:hypothetical protein